MKVEKEPSGDYVVVVTLSKDEAIEVKNGLEFLLRLHHNPSVYLPQTSALVKGLRDLSGSG